MRQLFGLSRMLRAVGGYQWWVWPLARLALVGASLNSSLLTLAIDPTGSTGPLGRNISSPIACCSLGMTNWKKWPICLDFSEAVGSLCQLLLEGQRITQLTHICRWFSVAVILGHPSQSHKFRADLVKLCQCSIRRAVILLKLLQKGDDCFELNPPIFFWILPFKLWNAYDVKPSIYEIVFYLRIAFFFSLRVHRSVTVVPDA